MKEFYRLSMKVQRWYVKIKTILKDILSAMFQKDKNTHLSPANRIFEKWAGLVYRQIEKSILPDDINDCLWAVQRLTAQIYEQLMRGHVCVEICLPLYIWGGKSGCSPCRILQEKMLLHTNNTLRIGCRNESFLLSGLQSRLIGAAAMQDLHI